MTEHRMLIDGQWIEARSGATRSIINPHDSSELGRVAEGDRVDAQLAVSIPIFGTKTHNIYWVDQDGQWKLSNPSACVIAHDVAGVDCTV